MDGWMCCVLVGSMFCVRCSVCTLCAVQFTGERDDINVKSVFYFQFDIIFGFPTEYRHQAKRSAKIETTANKVRSNKREIGRELGVV